MGEIEEGEDEGDFEDEKDPNEEGESSDEDEEEKLDALEHDEIILGNTSDVVNSLAKAFGDSFLPYFSILITKMEPYLSDSHPKNDRNMIIGCIAEVFRSCPSAIPPYYQAYYQVVMKNAQSSTDLTSLAHNLAFGLGVLAEKAQHYFEANLDQTLQTLSMIFHGTTE